MLRQSGGRGSERGINHLIFMHSGVTVTCRGWQVWLAKLKWFMLLKNSTITPDFSEFLLNAHTSIKLWCNPLITNFDFPFFYCLIHCILTEWPCLECRLLIGSHRWYEPVKQPFDWWLVPRVTMNMNQSAESGSLLCCGAGPRWACVPFVQVSVF